MKFRHGHVGGRVMAGQCTEVQYSQHLNHRRCWLQHKRLSSPQPQRWSRAPAWSNAQCQAQHSLGVDPHRCRETLRAREEFCRLAFWFSAACSGGAATPLGELARRADVS